MPLMEVAQPTHGPLLFEKASVNSLAFISCRKEREIKREREGEAENINKD